MRIIEVTSCLDCPYNHHEYPNNVWGWEPEYWYCHKYDEVLARKDIGIVTRPLSLNPITQEVTQQVVVAAFSSDGKTVWDGKIPGWCRLKEG
jgi:hypothetical protein